MNTPDQQTELQLGYHRPTNTHFFMCYGYVWQAVLHWSSSTYKPDSLVSDYSGDVYHSAIVREIEGIGKLTINHVKLYPSRFKRITELGEPRILREDMKGGEADTKPWFFRKAIPSLVFTSTFYHHEQGGEKGWRTTFTEVSSGPRTTPSQDDWVRGNIIGPLNRCFPFADREEFLQLAKARAAARWKDEMIEKAMRRMAHFRSVVEHIENHYDTLIP